MKKNVFGLLITGMLLIGQPVCLMASEKSLPSQEIKAQRLIQRLEEINTMDKSDLSSVEKRKLRREVHSIKKELNQMSGGVYISVGAIIIIALLLIILL